MWTAYALNNMGMGVNSLQEAYSELARYIDILVRDVELYLHREGWSDCTREKKRLKVLRCFLSAVYDVIEEEETNGPSLTVGRAQSLLEEMKLYSFLRPCMDILMDHMYHKDVKDRRIRKYHNAIICTCILIHFSHLFLQVHTELAMDRLWVETSLDNNNNDGDDNNTTLAIPADLPNSVNDNELFDSVEEQELLTLEYNKPF